MIKYVTMRIGGQEADLSDPVGLGLSFVYSVNDTEDPSKISGSSAKRTVTLPPTSTNNSIYQRFIESSRIAEDAVKRQECVVEVNGLPVFSGKAKLTEARGRSDKYRRGPSGYDVQLVGNNADWFSKIKAQRIKDFDYGLFTLNLGPITSAGNYTYPTNDYCFYPIKVRAWQGNTYVHPLEHYPALFIRGILERSFNAIGYTISSDFLDRENFERLTLPILYRPYSAEYAADNVNMRVATSGQQSYTHSTPSATLHLMTLAKESPLPNQDPGGNWITTSYTTPDSGYYSMQATFQSSAIPGAGQVNGYIWDSINTSAMATIALSQDGNFQANVYERYLGAGEIIQVQVGTSGAPTYTVGVDASFKVNYYKGSGQPFVLGDVLKISEIIPSSWLVKDLLLDLATAFNLRFETDPDAATVTIEPADRHRVSWRQATTVSNLFAGFIKHSPAGAIDFSGKIDMTKAGGLSDVTTRKQEYILGWKSDSGDATLERIEEESEIKLYDAMYQFPADRFPEGQTRVYTQFFSKTLHFYDPDVQNTASTATADPPVPQFPIMWAPGVYTETSAASAYSSEFEPRILYFAGRRAGVDGFINVGVAASATSAHPLPAAWMVNYNAGFLGAGSDGGELDPSLSFSQQQTKFETSAYGLMQRFHLQDIKRVENGKLLTEWLYWSPAQIMGLSFRDRIAIDRDIYVLKKVDGYNPADGGSTKTELLKDDLPDYTDLSQIDNGNLRGVL